MIGAALEVLVVAVFMVQSVVERYRDVFYFGSFRERKERSTDLAGGTNDKVTYSYVSLSIQK